MTNIKKHYNLILMLIFTGVFFVNSVTYAIDLPKIATRLRNPLIGSKDTSDKERLVKFVAEIMEASATELRKKMDRKRDNLTKLLIETLLPLKNSPITADRIESLFRSKDKEIYEIIGQMREIMLKLAIILNQRDSYVALSLVGDASPDLGICTLIGKSLEKAAEDIGLVLIPENIENDKGLWRHIYYKTKGSDGNMIAIDPASGQFIPENIRRVAVALFKDYDREIRQAVNSRIFFSNAGKAHLEKEFEEIRNYEILLIMLTLKDLSYNL